MLVDRDADVRFGFTRLHTGNRRQCWVTATRTFDIKEIGMPVSKNAKNSGSTKNRKVQGPGSKASQSKPPDTRVGHLGDWRVGGKAGKGKAAHNPPRDGSS